jgi:hypothetical protein
MRNVAVDRPVVFEGKTTTQGLSQYIQQCKPNHQITGYFNHAKDMLPGVRECVWDCTFISSRKPDMSKALTDRFWMYGIDVDNDFARQTTSRSSADVEAFLEDTASDALEYCRWATSDAKRWPRTAPGACHSYGGCAFRGRCSMNLKDAAEETAFMETFFVRKPWNPVRGMEQQ